MNSEDYNKKLERLKVERVRSSSSKDACLHFQRAVNAQLAVLKSLIPGELIRKRLPKRSGRLTVIQAAMEYIEHLQKLIKDYDQEASRARELEVGKFWDTMHLEQNEQKLLSSDKTLITL